ncbi:MAG: PDZ domain-containing protein, partial [candidate division KSB1 bacterium]|nr:PDZ domain-containing protein [candidate division KSB1 bacterium]
MKNRGHDILKVIVIIFGLLVAAMNVWAVQDYKPVKSDPVLEPWRWQSFPELNGRGVQCLAEAKDGSMWFGVDQGVMRYDGLHWKLYTPEDGLLGAPVTALCAASDGPVYAGTPAGINQFVEGTWHKIFPKQPGLHWHITGLMMAADGSLWAGSWFGALHIKDKTFTFYTTPTMQAGLKNHAPFLQIFIVPDEVAYSQSWSDGLGIFVVGNVISLIAPDGPAKAAGLKVGDQILAISGIASKRLALVEDTKDVPATQEFASGELTGPIGASVTLTIKRKGRPEPFTVTLSHHKIPGSYQLFRVNDIYNDREGALWFGLQIGWIVCSESHCAS